MHLWAQSLSLCTGLLCSRSLGSPCGGVLGWGHRLSGSGLSGTGSVVVVSGCDCPSVCDLPGPGIQIVFPALAGGILFLFLAWHVRSYLPTRDQTHAPCIGRAVLTTRPPGTSHGWPITNQWTTREAQTVYISQKCPLRFILSESGTFLSLLIQEAFVSRIISVLELEKTALKYSSE